MITNSTGQEKTIYMAMEISNKKWKLAFTDMEKRREVNIDARNINGLKRAIETAKEKFGIKGACKVKSCYEAGRDGFWIHRMLGGLGVENVVVDPASIEVPRRGRRVKTDRLDAKKLLDLLGRYSAHGEMRTWRVVTVPDEKVEDERRKMRERERLKKEETTHCTRIRSLLALHGITTKNLLGVEQIQRLKDWQGRALPAGISAELEREIMRLKIVREQMEALEDEQEKLLSAPQTRIGIVAAKMAKIKGIGMVRAGVLSEEMLGWRKFKNRREVGAMAGLTGTPYSSGESHREQGISKAGNRRVRYQMIELAWQWIILQPQSALTRWYGERFEHGSGRMRKVGIVALARKLLIALWKYVEFDEIPAGAIVKA